MRLISVLALASAGHLILAQQQQTQQLATSRDLSISCLVYEGLSFYDLRKMQNSEIDYSVQDSTKSETYYFNLCGETNNKCNTDVSSRMFAYKNSSTGECTQLTDLTAKKPQVIDGDKGTFVQFSFGAPDNKCVNAKGELVNYKLTVNLYCNSIESNGLSSPKVNNDDVCSPVIEGSNSNACPVFSVTKFAQFFVKRPQILGILAILFGLVVAFYGQDFFEITIFATGGIAGFGITMLLFLMLSMLFAQQGQDLSTLNTIFSFLFSVCIGIFLGFILKRMIKIGAAIMGAIGGVFLAFAVHQLLFFWVSGQASTVILWTLSVIGALGMAYLSTKQFKNILIFSTAFLGSYCVIRGISQFIPESFPAESTILQKIADGTIETSFYLYLSGFIILAGLGMVYQKNKGIKAALKNLGKL